MQEMIRLLRHEDSGLNLDDLIDRALVFYLKAEEQGNVEAYYRISELYGMLTTLSAYSEGACLAYLKYYTPKWIIRSRADEYRMRAKEYRELALMKQEPHALYDEYVRLSAESCDSKNVLQQRRMDECLRMAAEQGHPMAMYQYSKVLLKSNRDAGVAMRRKALEYPSVRNAERKDSDDAYRKSRNRRVSDCGWDGGEDQPSLANEFDDVREFELNTRGE